MWILKRELDQVDVGKRLKDERDLDRKGNFMKGVNHWRTEVDKKGVSRKPENLSLCKGNLNEKLSTE